MKTKKRIRVNIISWGGGGLEKDIDLLSKALIQAGCDVSYKARSCRRPSHRLQSLYMTAKVMLEEKWSRLTGYKWFDINFFLESIFPEYLPMARVNTLLVNPEWFREEIYKYLDHIDLLLCKTKSGVESVSDLSVDSEKVYFSSIDKKLTGFIRSEKAIRCLHLSGQSWLKGTEAVVEVWSRHPEWPELVVVRRAKRYGAKKEAPQLKELPNVKYLTDYVPEEDLKRLQNECQVHVVPSLAEGYGHVIGEAMSCSAVVVTTDAPPMNELIQSDRGILVKVNRTEPKDRSLLNYVDLDNLENKLNEVFSMTFEQRSAIGRRARAWYEVQHERFEKEILKLVTQKIKHI